MGPGCCPLGAPLAVSMGRRKDVPAQGGQMVRRPVTESSLPALWGSPKQTQLAPISPLKVPTSDPNSTAFKAKRRAEDTVPRLQSPTRSAPGAPSAAWSAWVVGGLLAAGAG